MRYSRHADEQHFHGAHPDITAAGVGRAIQYYGVPAFGFPDKRHPVDPLNRYFHRSPPARIMGAIRREVATLPAALGRRDADYVLGFPLGTPC